MKLIIDIPDEEYNECIERNEWDTLSLGVKLIQAVQNSTPLSEELEAIKAEFENKEGVFTSYHFVKAIDEHISELKGE